MPRIRAICLSDLHFGYWGSVLTEPTMPDPANPPRADIDKTSPVLVRLVECIEAVLGVHEGTTPPKLVLAGDVLELSLAYTNEAASVFAQFLDLLFAADDLPLDRHVVYLPGNHDHHLWELAREQQYTDYLREADTSRPFKRTPWHATHLFPWRQELDVPNRNVGNLFLDTIAEKVEGAPPGEGKTRFLTMYPNFGLLASDEERCTVFHHGHFTESIYYLMTELQRILIPNAAPPAEIWDVEVENFAWIEFLWGTLGRSGRVGKSVGSVYDMLRTPTGQCKLIHRLAWNIPAHFKRPLWLRPIEIPILYLVLWWLVKRFTAMERVTPGKHLSQDSRDRLEKYVGCYIERQLNRERKKGRGERMPKHMNFVFGHTHKPFEEVLDAARFNRPVHIYNSGGWVVDSVEANPRKGGAIVVVDKDGNAASIHMYMENADPGSYKVEVTQAGEENPLSKQLRTLVQPGKAPWSHFSGEVANAVRRRQEILISVTGG